MCGIFGILAQNAAIPAGVLARGTDSLAHRGPDDSGTVILRDTAHSAVEIGLGNRRLAILDLSSLAHQPMHDVETRNWIVYNGEIYNFREIRTELERAGRRFASRSDTEVVLKAYAEWGEGCVGKFRGMFAFAIWDERKHQLFIARDPMGIKPLYYASAGPYFLFASEVRSLLETGLVRHRINSSGILNYLTFGSAYDPLTLIEGIQALPAGHTLLWKDGTFQQAQYWDLIDEAKSIQADLQPSGPSNGTSQAEYLRTLLEEAVRSQLVSDVPLGVFLSGGIDSSALVSILSHGGIKPSTFSIVFREGEFSEAEHSRAVASRFKTDHHEITVSQTDVLGAIPEALLAMDLPTMDGVNTFFVSREARQAGVKVALSGLGGDEVFCGYDSFRTVPRMERFDGIWRHLPEAARTGAARAFAALSRSTDQNRKLTALMVGQALLHPYYLSRMLFTPDQRGLLLRNPDASRAREAVASQLHHLCRSRSLDPVNRVSYLESRCYMLNTLLRDSDFMSMSQGLELRVPLIDHRLAKWVLSLPGNSKLNATPKKLLVQALHGALPDEIVHRQKRGFTLPFAHWLRQELRAAVEPVLEAERVDAGPLGGLLNGKAVHSIWSAFLEGTVSWTRPWSLYVLQRWCELHA